MIIKDWTLVYNEGEAILFSLLPSCQITTNHSVENSDSFTEMINHCTANKIHVSDNIICQILEAQALSGMPIADSVAPALSAYLASGVKQPSAETLAKMMTAIS